MSSFKQWLETSLKQYLRAKELSDITCETDPISQPFKSKYEAKAIIEELLSELKYNQFGYESDYEHKNWCLLRILFNYELGSICVDTEDFAFGEKHLEIARNLLNDNFKDNEDIYVLLSLFNIAVNNQLGYIWCKRGDFEKALVCLNEAEQTYIKWSKSEEPHARVYDFVDAFTEQSLNNANKEQNSGNSIKNLEIAHTLTLYFLAQTHENMGNNSEAAIYCHSTLKRQYKYIETKEHKYDVIDWSINAATLSQYFAINGDFSGARHHLFCAKKVLNSYDDKEEERYNKAIADLNRIIVKYCLMLLDASSAVIQDEPIPIDNTFRPYLLNDSEVEQLEKELAVFPVTGFESASKVFKYVLNCLNEAKKYYTLHEHASDHVSCIQDHSKLYQSTIAFERDYDRQCKMHKRRIDLLENILKEISQQYFMDQTRQILFELGEIYSQMVELKLILMKNKDNLEQKNAAKKVNSLIHKGIANFSKFIQTFNDKSTNALPETLPEDYVRPILLSQFSIGRFYTKFLSNDPKEQLNNWSQCQSYYVKVRDYLNRNPQHKNIFEEELPLLEEMLNLIPGKMQMIINLVQDLN